MADSDSPRQYLHALALQHTGPSSTRTSWRTLTPGAPHAGPSPRRC